jgi:hypothetical protein
VSVLRELPYLAAIVLVIVVGAGTGAGATDAPGPSAEQRARNAGRAAQDAEERALNARLQASGALSLFDLMVGDCLVDVPSPAPAELDAVTCDKPHAVEVYAVFDLADRPWPGTAAIEGPATRRCEHRLDRDAPDLAASVQVVYPGKESWIEDYDREVTCMASYESDQTGRTYP